MTTFKTGNPVPSTAVRDLYDNAENFDVAINDVNSRVWIDRLGRARKTLSAYDQDVADAIDVVTGFRYRGDWQPNTAYAAKDVVRFDGNEFITMRDHTSSASFQTDLDAGIWTIYQGISRAELAAQGGTELIGFLRPDNTSGTLLQLRDFLNKQTPIHPSEKGGIGNGEADDTEAIRQCLLSGRPINTGINGEVWRLASTLNVTLNSNVSLRGNGRFVFDPPAVTQYGVNIECNGFSLHNEGAQYFDFQNKCYNGLYISNNSDTFSNLSLTGLLMVENVFRGGRDFTGDSGITFNGKFDGRLEHVKVRNVSCTAAAAIAGVAGACGLLFRAISSTRAPRNIAFGILDLDSVYKTSLADNVDQDGARLYAAEDTAGDLRPYNTKYTIDLVIGRNCVGRTLKFQCDWATVAKGTITREYEAGKYQGVLGGSEIDFQTGGGIADNITCNYLGGVPTTVTVFSGTVTVDKLTPYGKASNYQVSVAPGFTLDAVFRAGSRGTLSTVSFSANQVEVRGSLNVAVQLQPPASLVTRVFANMRDFFTYPNEALIRTVASGTSDMFVNVSGCPNLGPTEKPMLLTGSTVHSVYLNAADSALNWTRYERNVSGSTGPVARFAPIVDRSQRYGPMKDFFSTRLESGATWAIPKIAVNGNTCKGSIGVGRGRLDQVDFVADANGTIKNSPDAVGTSWVFGTTSMPATGVFRIWADADHVYIYNGHTVALYFSCDLQS